MKIVKEGDTRNVLCHHCGRSTATYLLRDVAFDDRSGAVKNILAAVCDGCQQVVSIPAQCTPQIKGSFEQTRQPLEVRLPAHYLDILSLAARKIDDSLGEEFSKTLILYYLHALNSGRYARDELKALLGEELAQARASKRLSMKISVRQMAELTALMQQSGIEKTSEVVKAVILKINQDLVQEKNLSGLAELRRVAAAYG